MSELFLEQSEQVLAEWDDARVGMYLLPISDKMRWRPAGDPDSEAHGSIQAMLGHLNPGGPVRGDGA